MWIVTDVELRRLFGQLNVLTESAVAALGGPLNKMPAVPAGADGEGTDQRLVLKRIAQLLDPCKSEEDRFTVCFQKKPSRRLLLLFLFHRVFFVCFFAEICGHFGDPDIKGREGRQAALYAIHYIYVLQSFLVYLIMIVFFSFLNE